MKCASYFVSLEVTVILYFLNFLLLAQKKVAKKRAFFFFRGIFIAANAQ